MKRALSSEEFKFKMQRSWATSVAFTSDAKIINGSVREEILFLNE